MTPRLLALAAAAALLGSGAPAQAEQICRSIRVDLINDWTYCAGARQNADGSVTVWVDCDMAQNPCADPSVTIP